MRPLAKCRANGHFEITGVTPSSTYDIVFQMKEMTDEGNTSPLMLKSQTVTINNADVDLGEILVPLEATRNRYRDLGLLSPPETINDDGVYVAFLSDHQAPTRVEDMLQFAYPKLTFTVRLWRKCGGSPVF